MSATEKDPRGVAPEGIHAFSRRNLLKAGGALVVLAVLPSPLKPSSLNAAAALAATDPGPAPTINPALLQSWIAVKADNGVLVRTGRLEMGVGLWTGISQIVADELYVPFDAIELIQGDTNRTPDGGVSAGGTLSVQFQQGLRLVAAYAREGLLNLAAAHFGVPASQLTVANGKVSGPSGSVTYAQLVKGQVLNVTIPVSGSVTGYSGVTVTGTPPLKDPASYTVVGKPVPRVDIPLKVTGKYDYLEDVRLPGMLHARMVRPKTLGSTLVKVNGFGKKHFPGARVVVKGNLVGVLSANEWEAIQAADALQVEWTDWKGLPGSDNLVAALRDSANPEVSTAVDIGDAATALGEPAPPPPSSTTIRAARAGHIPTGPITASYWMPVVYHGPIGPATAVADVQGGQITVHSCTSIPQILRVGIATMMNTSIDNVTVLHNEYSSQYGRTSLGGDDPSADAVLLANEVGKPVRVVWDRQDDHMWSTKVQPAINDMAAQLDASGNISAWSHNNIQGTWDSRMLGAILAGTPDTTPPPPSIGWSAVWLYDKVPNVLIKLQGTSEFGSPPNNVGLRFNIMRSPGNLQSVFGIEGFMNELAATAQVDPIQFRLNHTTDPRAIDSMNALKQLMKWDTRPSPSPQAAATGSKWVTGRGMAMACRNDGSGIAYVAACAEVKVKPSTGEVKVTHFWVADDSGLVVNPTGLAKVIQTGVIQGTSLALKEEVTFNESNVTSSDWTSYPILTMAEAPELDYVFVNNNPSNPIEPAGEPIANVVQPAIIGAFHDATGKFIRRVPLKPQYVKDALKA